MAEKSEGAEALLTGMADEMAALVRIHFDALKDTAVVAEAAAVDKVLKAVITVGRANLIVRAVLAAEDKRTAARTAKLDQMDMNDITPDELEQRAADLRARADRILALLEAKHYRQPVGDGAAGEHRVVGEEPKRRAA